MTRPFVFKKFTTASRAILFVSALLGMVFAFPVRYTAAQFSPYDVILNDFGSGSESEEFGSDSAQGRFESDSTGSGFGQGSDTGGEFRSGGVPQEGFRSGSSPCNPTRQFCNPIQSQNFTDLITRIAGIVAGLGIPVVAVVLVYGGFLFVSARGNEQKLGEAKQAFYWAIIGAALVLGAFVIAVALKNFAVGLG